MNIDIDGLVKLAQGKIIVVMCCCIEQGVSDPIFANTLMSTLSGVPALVDTDDHRLPLRVALSSGENDIRSYKGPTTALLQFNWGSTERKDRLD